MATSWQRQIAVAVGSRVPKEILGDRGSHGAGTGDCTVVIRRCKAEQNPFHFDGDELHAVLKQTDGGVADVSDTEEA